MQTDEQWQKKLRIFFDGEIISQEGFDLHLSSAEKVIELIMAGKVSFVSLGNREEAGQPGGERVARFIEQAFLAGEIEYVDFASHAPDPIAKANINRCKEVIFQTIQRQLQHNNETGFYKLAKYYTPVIEATIRQLTPHHPTNLTFTTLFDTGVQALKRAVLTSGDESHFVRFAAWWVKQSLLQKLKKAQG